MSTPPRPGFDVRIDARMPPDGSLTPIALETGRRHEIVVHVPGGEPPQATVPELSKAVGGLSLPKLGEKWSTSAPTGQGGVSVAVPLPAARGISPALAIGYGTQGGNGPFGWGWRLSLPYFVRSSTKAIVREHGRGLPEYDDANESDVFVFSDSDDLVAVDEGLDPKTGEVVIVYRARTEGGFARIERREKAGVSHFVVRSRDNVLSIFGRTDEAQIVDPDDPKRVYQWLLQEQRDELGNVVVYRYKREDIVGVDVDSALERGRDGVQPQRYLKRVLYGNRDASDGPIEPATLDDPAARERFMFEVVLDYGEHLEGADAGVDDDRGWPVRRDVFSCCRATFDVRTRRLCRRVLVYHRFTALNADGGLGPVLVRALELEYQEDRVASRLVGATVCGYDGKRSAALPQRRFEYSPRVVVANQRQFAEDVLHDLDLSAPRTDAELLDLDGTGLADLVTRESGRFIVRAAGDVPGTFAKPKPIPFGASPSTDPAIHQQRFLDLGPHGRPALVEFGPSTATVFERDETTGVWKPGETIAAGNTPPVAKDPIAEQHRVYVVDLDGDGIADVLVAKDGQYTWWRRMGTASKDGWIEQPPIAHDGDEDAGPGPVLFDAARDLDPELPRTEAIVFADMTGDGLADVVRLRADEVAYWPNLGRGRFGRKVVMDAPGLGEPVDVDRVRLCDVDGLGPIDVLYLGKNGATLWLNESGNRLVAGSSPALPPFESLRLSSLVRMDGRTTGSFAFAEEGKPAALNVVDFMQEHPFLLVRDSNGFGLRTSIEYATSTSFFVADRARGTPWETRMPLAIPVVAKVVVQDLVAGTRFTSSYSYAHGHYDPRERELRGFGRVEQVDSERFEELEISSSALQSAAAEHFVAPLRTRSWFHVGADVSFVGEYDTSDADAAVLRHVDPAALGAGDDAREALRALRGRPLRTESYGEAGDDETRARPIAVTHHTHAVKSREQGKHHTSVLVFAEQSLTYTHERQSVPDPRLLQTAVLEVDDFGHPLTTATVAYPRRTAVPEPKATPPKDEPDPPEVVLARVTGFLFDEAKSFVLPGARASLRSLAELYAEHAGFRLLVVGHTDREGKVADNDALSLLRAKSVAQFLRDDVDAWLAMYEVSVAKEHRFGAAEDAQMLAALGFPGDVVGFQSASGLDPDGDLGPFTRRELVRQYMGLDGTSLPTGTEVTAVGAGEHYPAVATADGAAEAANRRTELLLFAEAIEPAPPGLLLGPGGSQYPTWIARATAMLDVDATTGIARRVGESTAEPARPEEVDPEACTSDGPPEDPQLRTSIVVTHVKVVNQVGGSVHRLGTAYESSTFAVSGKPGDPRAPMTMAALRSAASSGTEIPFEQRPDGSHQRRLLSRSRTLFYDDALSDTPLPLGVVGARALPFETRQMAMSVAQVDRLFADAFAAIGADGDAFLKTAGYVHDGDGWWTHSGRAELAPDRFFLPVATIDPFGKRTGTIEYDGDHFLVVANNEVIVGADGAHNRTDYRNDYRVLAAAATNDPNNTTVARTFDALGMVTTEVTRGSRKPKLDSAPFPKDPFTAGDEGDDADHPTRRYEYDLHAFTERGGPTVQRAFVRLEHGRASVRVSLSATYFSGSGAPLQEKVRDGTGRFRTSGRTVVNNKGLPVLRYAPYVSGSIGYDAGGATKLVASMSYDALGRLVRTDHPDGTVERVEFDAWHAELFDRNDTVEDSEWLATHEHGSSEAMRAAARMTKTHANTPTHVRLDVLGRPVATFARLRDDAGEVQVLATRQVIDARGNVAEKREHAMLGQVLRVLSVDAGERRALTDASGAPLVAANDRGNVFRWTYDDLRRPLEDYVIAPGEPEVLVCKRIYGDGKNAEAAANASLSEAEPRGRHRGRLFRVYDGGGQLTVLGYDLDGNVELTERRLCNLPKTIAEAEAAGVATRLTDWSRIAGFEHVEDIDAVVADERLLDERDPFVTFADYDAHGRAILQASPSGAVQRSHYSEDGLLDRVERDDSSGTSLAYAVDSFDPLGRPLDVRHGEAARTQYSYDAVTERLVRLRTTSPGGKTLQDLHYAYDPIGNITRIRDLAQPDVFFANAKVEAVNDYRYDALYRLVEATGREHEGQSDAADASSRAPVRSVHPNDPTAMRRYVQRYRYDVCGNLTALVHEAGAGSFRRHYEYSAFGNRLRATGRRSDDLPERYEYDAHGNMTAMPHLGALAWNEHDQLERVQAGTQRVYLQYAGGVRIRKLVCNGEAVVEDRIYLGDEEHYEKRRKGVLVERTITEHVAGGALRIETKDIEDGKSLAVPRRLNRHQLTNHLGSTTLEVDEGGRVISYEEYHPFGTTAYRATTSEIDVPPNRYRYTSMERDEETGLSLHGARYYAPWLGRWTAADPSGLADGVNRFAYAGNRPIGSRDTSGLFEERMYGLKRVTTGRGSGGRGASVYEDDEDFIGTRANRARGAINAVETTVEHETRLAEQQHRRDEWSRKLIHGRGLETLINAQRARSARFSATYFSILMLPAAVGESVIAATLGSRLFFGVAAAYDADQAQAGVRELASGQATPTAYHSLVSSVASSAGCDESESETAASYAEVLTSAVFLLGGIFLGSSGRAVNQAAEGGTNIRRLRTASPETEAPPISSAASSPATTALTPYWPANRGFEDVSRATLLPGTRVDRYGAEAGTFVSPEGTPLGMRALSPESRKKVYLVYEVLMPIEVDVGLVTPWFGQPGFGLQFELPNTVDYLVRWGYLRRVTQ